MSHRRRSSRHAVPAGRLRRFKLCHGTPSNRFAGSDYRAFVRWVDAPAAIGPLIRREPHKSRLVGVIVSRIVVDNHPARAEECRCSRTRDRSKRSWRPIQPRSSSSRPSASPRGQLSVQDRVTLMTPPSRSTSVHWSARSSPRRSPAKRAVAQIARSGYERASRSSCAPRGPTTRSRRPRTTGSSRSVQIPPPPLVPTNLRSAPWMCGPRA